MAAQSRPSGPEPPCPAPLPRVGTVPAQRGVLEQPRGWSQPGEGLCREEAAMRSGRRPVPRGRARLWEHGRGGWRPWTQAPRLLWGGTQGVRPGRSPGDPTQGRCPEPLLTGSCLPPLLRVLGPRSHAGHPLRATRFLVLSPGVGVSVLMVKLTYRPAPHRPLPEAPAAPPFSGLGCTGAATPLRWAEPDRRRGHVCPDTRHPPCTQKQTPAPGP
nr:unnamed protein product [Rangifer tarandus platyrhynchus]CAI9689655.1 unnamed protein product [Rangifer tarandus platyrhynchus]